MSEAKRALNEHERPQFPCNMEALETYRFAAIRELLPTPMLSAP